TNVNDTVPRILKSGSYKPRPSVQTLASAMNAGNPTNCARVMNLFNADLNQVRQLIRPLSYTDDEAKYSIRALFDRYQYIACPHTAIAWLAAEDFRRQDPGSYATVFLSTAHPCKFPEVFPTSMTAKISIPEQVKSLEGRQKEVTS